MLLQEAIGEFVADLELAGRAERTVEGHELELLRLGRWLDDQVLDWRTVTRAQLRIYVRLRAHLGHSSRANMFCSLRTFYRWAVESGYVAMSPAAGFKTPTRPHPLPRSLTIDQVRQVVSYLAVGAGRRARRDEALLLTGLYAGLRAAELARLRWSDVDLSEGVINIELSKMAKGRAVPLHEVLVSHLSRWREIQAGDTSWCVFSLRKEPISAGRVGKIARAVSLASGVKFTSHVLRHTFATWVLRRSGNLYAVSKSLGHSQVTQTQVYVSADVSDLRAAVDQLPPLDSW